MKQIVLTLLSALSLAKLVKVPPKCRVVMEPPYWMINWPALISLVDWFGSAVWWRNTAKCFAGRPILPNLLQQIEMWGRFNHTIKRCKVKVSCFGKCQLPGANYYMKYPVITFIFRILFSIISSFSCYYICKKNGGEPIGSLSSSPNCSFKWNNGNNRANL